VAVVFTDRKARRAWRYFRLRVELMLSSVSRSARRELLEDLAAHVREMVADGPEGAGEYERLEAALHRMGDPRDFLAPLLGDAILRDPSRDVGLAQRGRAMLPLLAHGSRVTWHSASTLAAAILGALAMLIAFSSLLHPDAVGLFRLGPDDIQLRLPGSSGGGVPILTPWFAIGLIALSAALMAFAWRQARTLVVMIIMNGART
jgi:hypothetical protein